MSNPYVGMAADTLFPAVHAQSRVVARAGAGNANKVGRYDLMIAGVRGYNPALTSDAQAKSLIEGADGPAAAQAAVDAIV